MRRAVTTASLTVLWLALAAPVALGAAHDGGEGLWGETNDKVITNAGFVLIAFFPLFILVMSLLQHRLDRRKEERKKADKARKARADVRGGW
jgi:preprotein translocase subunit SecG